MSITEVLVQPQAIAWLPWAAQYFFYIGSAYAAAILFVIALVFKDDTSHRLRAALVLTLAIGAIVGPLALTADLHQPGRAWHFYPHLTPWSWMSMGAIFLPVFSMLATVTAWLYLRADLQQLATRDSKIFQLVAKLSLGDWEPPAKGMLGMASLTALSGLSIALYTGAEIAIVESRPLWHQPASPLLWFVTAFLGAVGFTTVLWLLFPHHRDNPLTSGDIYLLKRTVFLASVLALILIPIWASSHSDYSLFENTVWVKHLSTLTLLLLGCLVLAFAALRDNTARPLLRLRLELGLVALTALAATWFIRWVTLMEVQTIAKYDVGPYPYSLPDGANGWLGIVGMLGLWLALALLTSELVGPSRRTRTLSTTATH